MTKTKNRIFKNAILLNEIHNGQRVEIIEEDGVEVGFRINGIATTFGVENENGGKFESGDFDKSIRDYFVKNALNMLCPIEHNDYDFTNRGIISEVEDTGEQLRVVAEFYKDSMRDYEIVRNQIERGLFQGFSTFGWFGFDDEIYLYSISLVSSPADVGAKFFSNSKFIKTNFLGFGNNVEEPDIDPVPEIKPRKFDLMI